MSLTPYLHFQGNCAEAMRFYADTFGGALQLMTYADGPADMFPGGVVPADAAARVLHSCLTLPDAATLMASDFPPGMEGDPQQAVSVAITVDDVAKGKGLFEALAGDGAIIMPYAETFWAEAFGMVKDRFGTHWMISGPGKEPMAP